MAALYSSFLKLLLFLSVLPFISSLSTVSISETSNEPLICALVLSPNGNSSFLNCSSSGIGNSNVSFSGVVAGDGFVCGLRNFATSYASAMNCWRFSSNGTVMEYKRIYQGPALHQLEAGNSHICGVENDTNRLQCWQWPEFNSSLRFSSIAVGQDFVCGLSETGRISCNNGNNVTSTVIDQVPDGNYSVIDAGFSHACAISLDHSLRCWGDEVGETPRDMFNALALGENRSCALRSTNGTVVCWGQDNFTLPAALQETYFVSIEAKRRVFCGVEKSNFSLYCWGEGIDNFRMVFEKVLPGPCRRDCPYGILDGSGTLCGQMGSICEPLPPPPPQPQQPSSPHPAPPTPAPSPQSGDESSSGGGSGWSAKMVVLLVVGCVGSLSLLLVFLFFLYRQCKGRGCRVHDSGRLDEDGAPAEQGSGQRQNLPSQPAGQPVLEKRLSQLASMGNAGHLEEFSLQVLLEATDNFSANHKIGTGSFGSVYYGILDDGRQVAIKRAEVLNTSSRVGGTRLQEDKDHAFLNELESLSRLHHKNLVRLLGFCEDCDELVLVYEYMINGTLHEHLHKLEDSPLRSWPTRLKVALDAARGIEYLHEYSVPQIIHRDIKSSNILLDDMWTAKVSDFGLSMMGPGDDESHLSIHAAGTVGYMDPEYYRLQILTTKSDVYSFGVVLLELLTGHTAIHKNENEMPRHVVDFAIPYIVQDEIHRVLDRKVPPPTPYEIEAVAYVGYLAVDCVTQAGRDRPSMTEIVNSLDRALTACTVPLLLSRSSTNSST
ncbi:serine/threonine-protein kinase-like protein CCR4 isoform X2 [Pistacia vera]|uniref:serine/threonine-protein kinase-like protein CCR4 isoform X1 n=1 Tax=Pistacia vera TaxID=55513 RepID=UPI001263BC83|nr:serine/threonine-protein kinase-like protein CCR4 isoform X1 [Pistacia vera]XP_031249972.1 serine/threonine-protein kinase-like protein CCR4 isoform X2 [Pistacia vera]